MQYRSIKGPVAGISRTLADHLRNKFLSRAEEIVVESRPIGKILNEAHIEHLDVLFLDVEGGELDILQTVDWSISVYLVVIELAELKLRKEGVDRSINAFFGQ
ncbi:MAG: FkbM family methyltransferase [Parasphingorhabdus sp.]